MANIFVKDVSVKVPSVCFEKEIALYKIVVAVGKCEWSVLRRYSDFVRLNKMLGSKACGAILPPKKIFRNKNANFIESRRISLEKFIWDLVRVIGRTFTYEQAKFLDLHLYEVNYILLHLAQHFNTHASSNNKYYLDLTPLQIYAVTQCLQNPQPVIMCDCEHSLECVLDSFYNATSLTVTGSDQFLGTSNLIPNQFTFDFLLFKSLSCLKLKNLSIHGLTNFGSIKSSVIELEANKCGIESIREILGWDRLHFRKEDLSEQDKWTRLFTLNLSNNNLKIVDDGILLAENLEIIDLSFNQITAPDNLTNCPKLRVLSLENNHLESFRTNLPNITTLNLSKNFIKYFENFSQFQRLQSLDLSSNQINSFKDLSKLMALPELVEIQLTGNAISTEEDYRVKVLAMFGKRAFNVCLDYEVTTELEYSRISVFQSMNGLKELNV